MGARGIGAMFVGLGLATLVVACDPAAYDTGATDEVADATLAGDALGGDATMMPGCPPPPGTPPPPGCPPPPAPDAPEPTTTDPAATTACAQADDFELTGASAGAAYPTPTLSASCTDDEVVVVSNGIPDFTFTQVTPNALTEQQYTWRFPRDPAPAAAPSAIPLGGPAAIAVNGLPIFGPTEAPQDGYRDPVLDELLDYCNGHTAPGGVYHFHGRPDCLLEGLDGTPYVVVGYAFDGYPILSPWVCDDPDCVTVREVQSGWSLVEEVYGTSVTNAWEAHAYVEGQSELDACNGMTLADGSYAYFATDTFPYFLGCYRGTPTANGPGAPPE